MEESVSILRQDSNSLSHGVMNTRVTDSNELNTQCTRSHPVPHHSLSITLSDPEASSSSQIDSVVQPSVKPTTTVSGTESDTESAQLLVVDDVKCIGARSRSELTGVSAQNSEQQVCDKHTEVVRKSSFLSSIMEVADKHTYKSSRPMSAPSRSLSTTLPSGEKPVLQKQESNEKLKLKINIEEGARAALHQNIHVKAMSLPRDHKPASLSHENRSNGLSSNTPSPKYQLDMSESNKMEASIAGDEESCAFQNDEQRDSKVKMTDAVSSESDLTDNGDGMRSNTVEEKDIFVSFEAPQSPSTLASVDQSSSPGDARVLYAVGEESGRLRAASFSNKQIDSLLQTLRSLSAHDEVEDLNLLEGMIKSNTFKKAKHAHDSMQSLLSGGPSTPMPVVRRAVPAAKLVRQHFHQYSEPPYEVNELRELLRSPHVQAVLLCHDKVSTRDLYIPDTYFHRTAQDPVDIILSDSVYDFQAVSQPRDSGLPFSRDIPSCRKEDATIVFLEQTNRPLGYTIYKQDESVFIGKHSKGSDTEVSDLLREGDELLEINGIPVIGKSADEIIALMSDGVQSSALTIIPVHDDNVDLEYEPKYVKAHFNYNSKLDEDIPCKALGLTFQKGDILEVSNQDDPEWWQARKVFDDGAESLPGLIPSRHLQQQREALIKSYPFTTEIKKKSVKSFFSNRRKKKIYYHGLSPHQTFGVGGELPTYEDVVRFEPNPDVIRPIVLIGAPGVGRRTLIRKLLNSNAARYTPIIQYTTRSIRPGEVNGHDYLFVTREEFECDIEQDRFLEYGELKGCYYGTAFSSIKKIMESHRVPVLELHPQALQKVRHCGLKPYIVFVAPPRLERLHATRKFSSDKVKKRLGSTLQYQESTSQKVHSESDLQHLVHESYVIENQYGHYFDWIIINDDFQVAADMLKEVAQRVQEEPQWVPKSWYMDNY